AAAEAGPAARLWPVKATPSRRAIVAARVTGRHSNLPRALKTHMSSVQGRRRGALPAAVPAALPSALRRSPAAAVRGALPAAVPRSLSAAVPRSPAAAVRGALPAAVPVALPAAV